MNGCWVRGTAVLLLASALAPSGMAQGASKKYGELLKRLPEQANVLMLVDIDAIFDSPIGKREDWRERAKSDLGNLLGIGTNVSRYAVAAGVDFSTMQEQWKLGMFHSRAGLPDLTTLARREGGYVETMQNVPVVYTPRNFYLFAFPPDILGFAAPTDRKSMNGWLKSTIVKPRTFAPGWADTAVVRADRGAAIVLALDLSDAVSAQAIEVWLRGMPEVAKARVDPQSLSARLASVRSAFLEVNIGQTIEATLRVDFGEPIDYVGAVAKTVILGALDEVGVALPDFDRWSIGVKGNTISLSGRMEEESVRRVLSVVSSPRLTPEDYPAPSSPGDAAAAAPETPEDAGLKASQAYFRAVADIAESLRKTSRPTYQSLKLWYERAAKQIEELPILNVDAELLNWGSAVARTLREIAYGINHNVQDRNYRLSTSSNGYYAGYGYGYYGVAGSSKTYDSAVLKRQGDAVLSTDIDGRWQVIETSISDMRRKMVMKYMVDF